MAFSGDLFANRASVANLSSNYLKICGYRTTAVRLENAGFAESLNCATNEIVAEIRMANARDTIDGAFKMGAIEKANRA